MSYNDDLKNKLKDYYGTAFVIVYDLITESNFLNTHELLAGREDDDLLLDALSEISL